MMAAEHGMSDTDSVTIVPCTACESQYAFLTPFHSYFHLHNQTSVTASSSSLGFTRRMTPFASI